MPPKRTSTTSEGYQQVFYATAMFIANNTVGDEVYGDCPICGGENKFYVNTVTGMWSCKAGKPNQVQIHKDTKSDQDGNLYDWLQSWLNYCDSTFDKGAHWSLLAKERGIPVHVLKESGMVWDGRQWLIPAYNEKGTVISLCRWGEETEGQVRVVTGLKAPLFNLDLLSEYPKNAPIYLCEGPWDAMILQSHLEDNGVALGVPGAHTFKREWIDYFTGHPVIVCYDNDTAGQKGADKVLSTLVSVSQDLKQLVWPDDVATGWDVRDHFKSGGTLVELLERVSIPAISEDNPAPALLFDQPFGIMEFEKHVLPIFQSYLHVTQDIETSVRIAYATVLSNQIPGDPLWLQIVAPPGGTKTEILRAAGSVSNTMFLSTLRPASLVSGWKQGDPSVLPKLRGKTLVVRDLTEVLADTEANQRAVFGILRQAYDGEVYYPYGQGALRHYQDLWFSVLAGVTPEIFANPMASLGERFLVYHSIKGALFDDTKMVEAASQSKGTESVMREALQDITKQFLEAKVDLAQVPEIPQDYIHRLVYLAKLTAKLRGTVARHKYKEDILLYPPQHEVATRLVKQLIRLATCLSMLEPGMLFNARVYNIVKRVALDSCNSFNIQIATLLAKTGGMSLEQLVSATNLPHDTVSRRIDDMRRLGSVESAQIGTGSRMTNKYMYDLTESVKFFWKQAQLPNGKTGVKFEELEPITVAKKKFTIKRNR